MSAQISIPIVENKPTSDQPTNKPENLQVQCFTDKSSHQLSTHCPVITWDGITYWVYGYNDNRKSLVVVAYDSQKRILRQWHKEGIKNLWRITVEADSRTITLFGQEDQKCEITWQHLLLGNNELVSRVAYISANQKAKLPSNIQSVDGGFGVLFGVASMSTLVGLPLMLAHPLVALPGFLLGTGLAVFGGTTWITGSIDSKFNTEAKKQIAKYTFDIKEDKFVTTYASFKVKAAVREDKKVDFLIQTDATFSVTKETDPEKVKVFYQDICSFAICPKSGADIELELNANEAVPKTVNKSVNYKTVQTWNAKAGISTTSKGTVGDKGSGIETNVTASGEVSYIITTDATVSVNDVEIMLNLSDREPNSASWQAVTKQVYTDVTPHPYDVANYQEGITVNGAFTKWFKNPPDTANNALGLSFLSAFRSKEPLTPGKNKAYLPFNLVQRVIYGEIAGRGGAAGAKVGGTSVVLPLFTMVGGTLVIDIENNKVTIEDKYETLITLKELTEPPFAFKASNGKYICAETGGGGEKGDRSKVVANRDQVRAWEKFFIIDISHPERSMIGIKTGTNYFLRLVDPYEEGARIFADGTELGSDETFEILKPPSGEAGCIFYKENEKREKYYVYLNTSKDNHLCLTKDRNKAEVFKIVSLIPQSVPG